MQYTHGKAFNNHDSESQCNQPQALASAGSAFLQMQTHQRTQPQVKKIGTSAQTVLQMNQGRFARAARQVPPEEILKDGVAVVWPGLGEEPQAHLVWKNVQWLKQQGIPFDCWIFVYKSEEEFTLNAKRGLPNEADYAPCNIIRHPGFWMSHVLEMPLNLTKMPFILHILDSVEPQADINLKSMYQIMRANSLGVASATFPRENTKGSSYPLMVRNEAYEVGRQVDFIEYHFSMFTREYFACFQDKIDANNFLGWGMDLIMPQLCGGSSFGSDEKNGNLGLLDNMTILKPMGGSYNYTDAGAQMQKYLSKFPNYRRPLIQVLGPLVPAAADAAQSAGETPDNNDDDEAFAYIGCFINEPGSGGHVWHKSFSECHLLAENRGMDHFGMEDPHTWKPGNVRCLPLDGPPNMMITHDTECEGQTDADGHRLGGYKRLAVYKSLQAFDDEGIVAIEKDAKNKARSPSRRMRRRRHRRHRHLLEEGFDDEGKVASEKDAKEKADSLSADEDDVQAVHGDKDMNTSEADMNTSKAGGWPPKITKVSSNSAQPHGESFLKRIFSES
jgi:hypothetical protein